MTENKRGVTGFGLKMIAVVTMLLDHTAASVLARMLIQQPQWGPINQANYGNWFALYNVLRCVGRMAFPIYCFLLVEGFFYTKSRVKYALRLFCFALVSEIPFDLALNESLFDFGYNNVFFTLLFGLLTMMAAEDVMTHIPVDAQTKPAKRIVRIILLFLIVFAGCALAEFVFRCDYGATGVLAIYVLYRMRDRRCVGFALAVLVLALLTSSTELWALLMLVPLYFYNGKRGPQIKYFFYAFYPVHLLILGFICLGLGLFRLHY